MHLKRFFFPYALIFFITLFIASAFFRFVYLKDFEIIYESSCDPATSSCFAGCMDKECVDMYPYQYMRKHATDIVNSCGSETVEECESAHYCRGEDRVCEVSFCNELSGECYRMVDSFDI